MTADLAGGDKTPMRHSTEVPPPKTLNDLIDRISREAFLRSLERRVLRSPGAADFKSAQPD
jgi:hypothetical protein